MLWDKIKKWYKGDDGNPELNFELQQYEYQRPPKRHWLAKAINKFIDIVIFTWRLILKNPNIFITQLFAFLAIVLAAASLYLQFNKNDENYQRCAITSTDKDSVDIKCRK